MAEITGLIDNTDDTTGLSPNDSNLMAEMQ